MPFIKNVLDYNSSSTKCIAVSNVENKKFKQFLKLFLF